MRAPQDEANEPGPKAHHRIDGNSQEPSMILDSMSLKGKSAIITGAGRGIGRGVAQAYAEAGADLVLVSRTVEQAEEAATELRHLGVVAFGRFCGIDAF